MTATIYNFQKAATLKDDSRDYWNRHYCVNRPGDSSGEYVPLADYKLIITQRDALLAACEAIQDAFVKGEIKFTRKRQSDSDPYHPANVKLAAAAAKGEADAK